MIFCLASTRTHFTFAHNISRLCDNSTLYDSLSLQQLFPASLFKRWPHSAGLHSENESCGVELPWLRVLKPSGRWILLPEPAGVCGLRHFGVRRSSGLWPHGGFRYEQWRSSAVFKSREVISRKRHSHVTRDTTNQARLNFKSFCWSFYIMGLFVKHKCEYHPLNKSWGKLVMSWIENMCWLLILVWREPLYLLYEGCIFPVVNKCTTLSSTRF